MVDTRESLGDFESSIFDASDGHKLVDLIRRKKGLNVQTQKIFDDVPANRPSLQIEIQRLEPENETLKPEKNAQQPIPANKEVIISSDIPPSAEFVPKSPKRPSSVRRSLTSPIIKMNSTTLGRRTLLKEFEKAFANESRFLPEICSTPIISDIPNKINHANKNDLLKEAEKKTPEENIICSPITLSDEGSPVQPLQHSLEDPTLKGNCSNESTMRSLVNQNELLNALLVQSQKEQNASAVNRELPKSPRRTFTVECDILNGKITLSPSKSKQNNAKDSNTFTKKLTTTSEQLKVFNKLGLGLGKGNSIIQKASRIPTSQKKPTTCVASVLTNQETTTAEFVERLQKNATPNCPVIVIPVNQTFNQAPVDRIIEKDSSYHETSPLNEITSTISGNTPGVMDSSSRQKETHIQANRAESPLSNVISSTTISNGEQFKDTELPAYSLRWDGIITDDASSSDNSDCCNRKTDLKNERRKVSKSKKLQKQNSAALKNKKLSVNYKSLNLHMQVDNDEEGESDLPQKCQRKTTKVDDQRRTYTVPEDRESDLAQKSQRQATKVDEQRRTYTVPEDRESDLAQKSQRQATKVDEQRRTYTVPEDRESDLAQKSQRQATKVDEQRRTYNLPQEPESDSPQKSRRQTTKVDEQRRTYNLPQEPESDSPQKSRRQTTKVDEQRRTYNLPQEPESDSPQKSGRQTTKVDEQRRTYNLPQEPESDSSQKSRRQTTKVDEQRRTYNLPQEPESDSPQKSRRQTTKVDEQRRTYNLPQEPESDSPQKSRRQTTQVDEQRRTYNVTADRESDLLQKSRRQTTKERSRVNEEQIEQIVRPRAFSKVHEERDIHLEQRRASYIDEQHDEDCDVDFVPLSDTDREEILNHRSRRKSKDDEEVFKNLENNLQQSKEVCTNKMSQQRRRESSETGELQGKGHEYKSQPPTRRRTSNITDQCNEEYNNNLPKRSSRKISVEKRNDDRDEERENNFAQQSDHEPSEFDDQQSKQRELIVDEQPDNKKREKRLTRRSDDDVLEVNEKLRKEIESQQKTFNVVEHGNEQRSLQRRSRREISSIDEEILQLRRTIEAKDKEIESFKNLMPPVGFRDLETDSNLECTNSISVEQDLIDELSTDRLVMDAFKKPTKVIGKKKKRKAKIIPKNVKEYLEANEKVARTQYLNISKRKLYSKGNSDIESSDECSSSRKPKTDNSATTSNKSKRQSRKSLTRRNVDNKETETSRRDISRRESRFINNRPSKSPSLSTTKQTSSRQILPSEEVKHTECTQIRPSRSRRRSSPSSSEYEKTASLQNKERSDRFNNNDVESNDKNMPVNLSESTPKAKNIPKNSRRINKNGPNLGKKGAQQERGKKSMLLGRRSSESSSDSSGQRSRRTFERNQKKRNSSNSSRSRSPQRRSTVQTASSERDSQEVNNKDVDSNIEKDIAVSPSKLYCRTTSASPTKTIKTPGKSKANLNSLVTREVESNQEKDFPPPPAKTRKPKKKNVIPSSVSSLNLSFSTASSIVPDCGPRRSKRESKPPTAYWACSNSEYKHAFDIYNMLTAVHRKKPYFPEFLMHPEKKNKKKDSSTDDNLVANTNEVDSSSKKNKNKTKQQSKRTNKKVTEPKTIENKALQSESETDLRRPSISSECQSLPQLQESSGEERQTSTVKASGKTKPRSRPKSKHKTEEKLGKSDSSDKDSSSDTQNSKSNSNSLPSTEPNLSTSDSTDNSNVQKRRLTTIAEDAQTHSNQSTGNTLMPPPKTNLVKKVNKVRKKNTFHTEHDDSIADVSSIHVNNLFDQLKNSSVNNSMINRSRVAMNSSGQVSLDSRNTKTKNASKSGGRAKNVSVRLQRLNLQQEASSDGSDKHFDSGFSSEEMNSINTKKDILLDWLVQMLNNGKASCNKQKGLARFIEPNGFATANIDELTFEEIDGVDFAFYNSPGQKFGYLRFKPRTQKKLSCAKRYELNFVLLGGVIQMSVDKQTFDMKNGDLTTIYIGTSYRMRNITDDPALVMVIRN